MKRFFILIIALFFVLGALTACRRTSLSIKPPFISEYCVGKNYISVKSSLQGAGFTNISEMPIEDLDLKDSEKDGNIETISIDGNKNFSTEDTYTAGSMVIIEYHTMKTLNAPISSKEAESKNYEEIKKLFIDGGFTEVSFEEVYDLDPDSTNVDFKNVVSINGTSTFDVSNKFPINSKISMVRHLSYEKYTVNMNIDFVENLFFSKYNVDLILDGTKQYTLQHGTDADYTFRLKEGRYIFTFSSVDSSSIKGEITLEVKNDIDVSYQIACYSDNVTVKTLYLDNKTQLNDNQIKITTSASNFVGTNVDSVVNTLRGLGFTNIKEVPVYDIIFDITKPGSIKSVSIGGSTTYKHGDVFTQDAEIIVTYSLRDDDDPYAPKTTETSSSGTSYQNQIKEGKVGDCYVRVDKAALSSDLMGDDVIVITYTFKNNSSIKQSFSSLIDDSVTQNGVECRESWFTDNVDSSDSTLDVSPGSQFTIKKAYELNDTNVKVDVKLTKPFAIINTDSVIQTFIIN